MVCGDDDIKDALGAYMSEYIMKDIDLYNLRVCWTDFMNGVSDVDLVYISNVENKKEWVKLLDHFALARKGGCRQQDLITESMADWLHKCMAIACSHGVVCEIEKECPGWPWLLMEVDRQVAKGKGIHDGMDVEQVGGVESGAKTGESAVGVRRNRKKLPFDGLHELLVALEGVYAQIEQK